ncbi:head formation protein [Salmonella phage SEA1]|uniref:Head vertex assembly chaperone n=1 Tax=Salmonella phage vB_SnwM_CGG4-1 TaxID=1815631 RepID=A0A1B0VUZ8_9CAUD|nr:head vertex assembly chaperone [Salmonella phage vB_SnwM_CGG4-1]ANA49387.1 head vertex assembly chaperone [Salmonella phage vB_SnwM_CGG4-1]WKV23380.1 head formation protein [Salmonella phage SEA1]
MKQDDYDLSELDLNLEVVEEAPSQEGEFERTERVYQKSLDIVKKAMSNIVQEILLTLEDGSSHIVYVTSINHNGNEISVDFSTLSEDRKAELAPHVEKCVKIQIEQALAERNKKRFKLF